MPRSQRERQLPLDLRVGGALRNKGLDSVGKLAIGKRRCKKGSVIPHTPTQRQACYTHWNLEPPFTTSAWRICDRNQVRACAAWGRSRGTHHDCAVLLVRISVLELLADGSGRFCRTARHRDWKSAEIAGEGQGTDPVAWMFIESTSSGILRCG